MIPGKYVLTVHTFGRVAYAQHKNYDGVYHAAMPSCSLNPHAVVKTLTDMSCIYTDTLLAGHEETTDVSSKYTASNSKGLGSSTSQLDFAAEAVYTLNLGMCSCRMQGCVSSLHWCYRVIHYKPCNVQLLNPKLHEQLTKMQTCHS